MISIITVTRNAAATIADCLASVAGQSVRPEHVIVDGASTDGTLEIVRGWTGHPVRVSGEPDQGVYDAMNKGLACVTGDIIGILNADDVYADVEVLARVQQAMSDPGVEGCYGDLVYVKAGDEGRGTRNEGRAKENRERGTGNGEQGTRDEGRAKENRERGTGNGEQGTRDEGREAGDRRQGTGARGYFVGNFVGHFVGTWNVQRPTSNVQHRTANIERPTSNDQRPTANIERPTSNVERPTSNVERPRCQEEVIVRYWRAGEGAPGSFYWGWMPPHPTFFVRRSVYERYGGFRLDMGSAADYELMLRLMVKHRIRSVYIPRVQVRMRVGGVSNVSVKNRVRANRMDREAWRVNELRPYPWTLVCKPLRKVMQWWVR